MDLLGSYSSQDEEDGGAHQCSSTDSDGSHSDASEDSAQVRARLADERLRDLGDTSVATSQEAVGQAGLPSALAAFDTIDGPPPFLDPEAIRRLAANRRHGLSDEALAALEAAHGSGAGGRKAKQAPGKDFDISVLAPRLKGGPKEITDKRDLPAGALIEAKAKRYKPAEDAGPAVLSPAIIAMLGGNVADSAQAAKSMAPTKPMAVPDFLIKGHGAAQLPRKNPERKDKEKEKRMKGQSTHANWKSEAEMVLRQQYD